MKPFRKIDSPIGRLIAIGDIHACCKELEALLGFLKAERGLSSEDLVVFMGDYIDRGSDAAGVIKMLLQFQQEFPSTVFLKGNHEDMLLDHLGFEGNQGSVFIVNGGAATLASYGISASESSDQVALKMPTSHLGFLLNLDSYVMVDKFVFAHAGLHPLKPLDGQKSRDLFWIREEFIGNIHPFEITVVFGHTPYKNVLFNLPYKIGIDTGLVYGNMLSCVDFTSKEIVQVRLGTTKITVRGFPS
ncbi:MAG: serine/threonine protein phosphatase [SAR324 cluster bacterium]|uniref:Serine/threonine protein phosphatase n=1 Tax=SAR324 cluster bacterium TaxID=2024889 RepID=A0A7X9FTV3_9DELT|nr:serine/threonine protein phosphatase [SAR324 cluster bacterium]